MKKIIVSNFIFALLANIAVAGNYRVFEKESYVDIKTRVFNNLELTEKCFKSVLPKCDAFDATIKKTPLSKSTTDMLGNLSSRYCHDKGGSSRILIDNDNRQFDFCLFKDKSMIDAWDLYYKHYPK